MEQFKDALQLDRERMNKDLNPRPLPLRHINLVICWLRADKSLPGVAGGRRSCPGGRRAAGHRSTARRSLEPRSGSSRSSRSVGSPPSWKKHTKSGWSTGLMDSCQNVLDLCYCCVLVAVKRYSGKHDCIKPGRSRVWVLLPIIFSN